MCQLLPYRSEVAPEFWIYANIQGVYNNVGQVNGEANEAMIEGTVKKFPLLLDKGGQLEYLFYIQHQSLSRNSSA